MSAGIWHAFWRDLVLFSVDAHYGEEIAECRASVIRTERRAHIDRAPYEAALARMHAIDKSYHHDLLAMFGTAGKEPTPKETS